MGDYVKLGSGWTRPADRAATQTPQAYIQPALRLPRAKRPKPGSLAEREAILRALDNSRLNMTRAAQLLGVARATFYRMLRRHRIEPAPTPDLVRPGDMHARW